MSYFITGASMALISKFIRFVLSLIILLTVSCSSNGVEPGDDDNGGNGGENPEPSDLLIPLETGNYWQYKWYLLDVDGSEIMEASQTETRITGTDTVEVNGEMTVSHIWTRVDPTTGQQDEIKWLFANLDDGLYTMGGITSNQRHVDKFLKYKFPAEVNESWLYPHLVYDLYLSQFTVVDTVEYTCVATNEEWITNVGSFECYVYHHREGQGEDVVEELDIYEYYAPNVGLVGVIIKGYLDNFGEPESYYKFKQVLYSTNVL